MEFRARMTDPARPVYLFGTVPPSLEAGLDEVYAIADMLRGRLEGLEVDGINVYDVQQEKGRNGKDRPFPFLPVWDPRRYGRILQEGGVETICYASVPHIATPFAEWLAEAREVYRQETLALVGSSGPASAGTSLAEAARLASGQGFLLGGVTIPERHTARGDEHHRMRAKTRAGLWFFTSQVVYQPDQAISLLKAYGESAGPGECPARIVFTFAPFGSERTLEFLEWLGVDIPERTKDEILSSADPLATSLQVCRSNLRKILDAGPYRTPLGINVESVSKSKKHIDAAVQLFSLLQEEMENYQ